MPEAGPSGRPSHAALQAQGDETADHQGQQDQGVDNLQMAQVSISCLAIIRRLDSWLWIQLRNLISTKSCGMCFDCGDVCIGHGILT